jgi:hypothetical protein
VRHRGLGLALVVLAAYVGVLALTVELRNDHVRPLYDGFAPPSSYRWVDPPSFFESGNVEPTAGTATIRFGRNGSAPAGVATPDGQFVLNFGPGAIAPSPGSPRADVKLSPVAPSELAPLPSGLRANGNAYRLQLAYSSGATIRSLEQPGNLVLEIPELGDNLFFSSDGRHWSRIDSRAVPPRQLSLTAAFERPGYFVSGTTLPELVGPEPESGHALEIGLGAAALALVGFGSAFFIVRRARRREHSVTETDTTLP